MYTLSIISPWICQTLKLRVGILTRSRPTEVFTHGTSNCDILRHWVHLHCIIGTKDQLGNQKLRHIHKQTQEKRRTCAFNLDVLTIFLDQIIVIVIVMGMTMAMTNIHLPIILEHIVKLIWPLHLCTFVACLQAYVFPCYGLKPNCAIWMVHGDIHAQSWYAF